MWRNFYQLHEVVSAFLRATQEPNQYKSFILLFHVETIPGNIGKQGFPPAMAFMETMKNHIVFDDR